MKDHCHYCNKALYRMYMRQGAFFHEDDKYEYCNSDNDRVCKSCSDRLIYRGSVIECSNCDMPIYTIRSDRFVEDDIGVHDLVGIEPQHDPIEGVVNRCTHCKTTLEWG